MITQEQLDEWEEAPAFCGDSEVLELIAEVKRLQAVETFLEKERKEMSDTWDAEVDAAVKSDVRDTVNDILLMLEIGYGQSIADRMPTTLSFGLLRDAVSRTGLRSQLTPL